MDELEQRKCAVENICLRLGATPEQAPVLTAQLLKRARQVASVRGCSRVEALDYLLRVMISGRQGEIYPHPTSEADSGPMPVQKKCL